MREGNEAALTAGTVTLPSGQVETMRNSDPEHLLFAAVTNSLTALQALYPSGQYQFAVTGGSATVTLPSIQIPNAPTLQNYAAAQTINPAADYVLAWTPFQGGTTSDYIGVSVSGQEGTILQSPSATCPDALNGTAQSMMIPANTLTSNTTYQVVITFVRVESFDTTTIPGTALLSGTEAVTEATIAAGVASSVPVLSNAQALPGGGVAFDVSTAPGTTYSIQFNTSLNDASGWTTLLITNAVGSSVSFSNTPGAGFYRVMQ